MATMRPLIGIGCDFVSGGDRPYAKMYSTYIKAVLEAKGTPILLPPIEDEAVIGDLMNQVHGLILPGGDDIPRSYFGGEDHPTEEPASPMRIAADSAFVLEAVERKVPFLGICFGAQILNVALGGGLIADIPDLVTDALDHKGESAEDLVQHDIEIVDGTVLGKVCGAGTVSVNSYHHQAIGELGRNIRISAKTTDGVIEAIEVENHPYCIGVQWHPEKAAALGVEQGGKDLFVGLIKAARDFRAVFPLVD